MSNINALFDQINQMPPLEIIESPIVRDKFITIYDTLWGEGSGAAAYERESLYFNKLLRDTDGGKLLKATPFSIFTAFIDVAVSGLSLEPGPRALGYLVARNYKTGAKNQATNKDIYEGRVVFVISAYGELVKRARDGQIRYADNPVIVYANDEFRYGDRDGRKFVDYVCNMPHTGQPITACFLRITRADGSIDYSVMLPEDWARLAGYSERQNRRWDAQHNQWICSPNELYGKQSDGSCNIDTGFLAAKCIKHAFKTYPKVRVGKFTELQSQRVDEVQPELPDDIYGVDIQTGEVTQQPDPQPQPFGNPEPPRSGVTIDTDAYDDGF